MRVNFLSFLVLGTLAVFVSAHGGGNNGGHDGGNYPQPSQTPTTPGNPGHDCPDTDAGGHKCTRQENLGGGRIKCYYDYSNEGGKDDDNNCEYETSKGGCSNDHNYGRCSSQAKPHKREPAPPTAGHIARAPRALKQLKMKRTEKSRLSL